MEQMELQRKTHAGVTEAKHRLVSFLHLYAQVSAVGKTLIKSDEMSVAV